MGSIWRISRRLHSFRSIAFARSLTSSPLPPPFRSFEHQGSELSQGHKLNATAGVYIPALLAGLFGVGLIDVVNADANEISAKNPMPSKSPEYSELEEIARKERLRLEEKLQKKGAQQGFCPRFTIAVKGQKEKVRIALDSLFSTTFSGYEVTIRFKIPPDCEIPRLISNLVSHLGVADNHGAGSNMILRAWDSGVAWQLTLSRPQDETVRSQMQNMEINEDNEDLCILIFRPLINSDKAELEFMKQGSLTEEELEALASVLQLAGEQKGSESTPRRSAPQVSSAEKAISSLEAMGVKIYGIDEPVFESSKSKISWDNIAGYNQQKREIEDTILLALQSPEVYDDIARGTRCKFETNRPRAVLFEGPPGTGKTSSARVIANQAGVPLVYVPLEVIMSKYYGESERMLGKVFSLVNELPNGAIVFLDEVDSLAVARDGETHEATRRLLSVLLRQIDGFEQERKVVVVAATNRKQDLDPALISRFDAMINFGLPDDKTRQEIAAQYAKHLTKPELAEFAAATAEMSGRDIRDVCQQAERHWASKIIRGQVLKDEKHGSLPPLQEYIESATTRRQAILSLREQIQYPRPTSRKPLLDFQ